MLRDSWENSCIYENTDECRTTPLVYFGDKPYLQCSRLANDMLHVLSKINNAHKLLLHLLLCTISKWAPYKDVEKRCFNSKIGLKQSKTASKNAKQVQKIPKKFS